jgi:membrane-associated phospholipid phosphatase
MATVAVGVAAPLLRRRVKLPKAAVLAAAWSAPVALCVATPRSPKRDVAVSILQMWAYFAAYEMPADDPDGLERRAYVDYPVKVDRVLGLGELPAVRLQRRFADPGNIRAPEKVLIWAHWIWFLVPHATVAYVFIRRRDQFPKAAAMVYGTFDLGLVGYWLVPTAPPWYAAQKGRLGGDEARTKLGLRRMMIEYGEQFWRGRWPTLYDGLAGNPLAAMPSLHFATSVMSAHVLSDVGLAEGTVAWVYAGTLGFALVYLGEHYVIDLLAGLALVEGIRTAAPRLSPLAEGVSRLIQGLEHRAQGA